MNISYSEFTSAGAVRPNNQDSIFSSVSGDYAIFVVADGMGGHFGGEIASSLLTDSIRDWWNIFLAEKQEFEKCCHDISDVIQKVNEQIYNEYSKNGKICGTTAAILFLYEDMYYIINSGDTRIYKLSGFKLKQETVDHVYGKEAVISGDLSRKEAAVHHNRYKLTSSVGGFEHCKISSKSSELRKCCFFMCSDGVYKYCKEWDIFNFCMRNNDCEKLVQKINVNGAEDNYSYIRVITDANESGRYAFKKYAAYAAVLLIIAVAVIVGNLVQTNQNDISKSEYEYIYRIDQNSDDADAYAELAGLYWRSQEYSKAYMTVIKGIEETDSEELKRLRDSFRYQSITYGYDLDGLK